MRQKQADNEPDLIDTLRQWQLIEDGSIAQTTLIMEKTTNPLIRLVMEIIRQDSVMHKKVQQVMIDGLEKEAFSLTPEELGQIWSLVERHAEMEKDTLVLAERARRTGCSRSSRTSSAGSIRTRSPPAGPEDAEAWRCSRRSRNRSSRRAG
jgi:hypothetical protein